eukprot:COSAG01_NODE_4444_length_5017_cov_4.901179_2_plen_40_part_00
MHSSFEMAPNSYILVVSRINGDLDETIKVGRASFVALSV